MSRTIVYFITSIVSIGAIFAGDKFGIEIEAGQVITVIFTVIAMITGQSIVDKNRVYDKEKARKKFMRPEFWITVIGILSPILQSVFGLAIPAAITGPLFPGIIATMFAGQYRAIPTWEKEKAKEGRK